MTTEKPQETLAEFSMSPFGRGESLSAYISRSLDIVDRSGIDYLLTPWAPSWRGNGTRSWR